ncbi:YhdP family protein [Massilia sp. DWR3-1-1]|uniref:YhdP family protein n=1 Tax=Massilia sp. DWR3-1-1 TaxID=2804559 RepID=UPI003CF73A99
MIANPWPRPAFFCALRAGRRQGFFYASTPINHLIDSQATEGVSAHPPLAQRWRSLRAAWRLCDRASHHILGWTVRFALLVYFAFAILFLLLRYVVLPNIDYYKGDIERLASRAVGNQVSIARIYASWQGLRPNLFLGDVVLRDGQGRAVLSLPSVSATFAWWTVLAGDARFESLELIRPSLDVRRDASGRLSVAGIVLDNKKGGAPNDWALRQHHIVIRDGRIDWTDLQRQAPTLALERVELSLTNNWNRHRFAMHATPPPALSAPLDVRADFSSPRFAVSRAAVSLWKGELYADLRDTDLAAWKPYLDYPFALNQGKGSVRAWLTLDQSRLAGFTADLALSAVALRLGPELPPLALRQVSGRLSASETIGPVATAGTPTFGKHGHRISLDQFAVVTADGVSLPPTTLAQSYTPAARGKREKTVISARALDLALVAQLAAQAPLSPAERSLLAELAPRGRLRNFSAEWEGRYPSLPTWRVRGQLEQLGLNARPPRLAVAKTASREAVTAMPAIPGFDHLSGTIDASERGGTVELDSPQLRIELPQWFADPAIDFDKFDLRARWQYPRPDQVAVQIDQFEAAQGALHVRLHGKHVLPLVHGKGAGEADLHGELTGFSIKSLDRYLPLQTPAHLRAWLVGALEDGMLQDATVRLRGDLSHFPFQADTAFERNRGEFRVAGRLENARLNYTPGHLGKDGKSPLWPLAERINGSIVFDRTRMDIKADSASTAGVALSNVKAVIPDLLSRDMQLEIDGSASGPLQEFLRYVGASPVTDWIGHFTDDARASNGARLGLKLRLPLAHLPDTKVQGVLQLMNNDITLFDDLPPLQAALGKIEFTERGVSLNGVGASFLGGPLALTGGTQKDNSILIKLAGQLSADGLRKAWPAPAVQRLTAYFSGETRFTGAVAVRDHRVDVTVDSSLAGMGLGFPAPLSKSAAVDTMPLRFVLSGQATGDAALARDEIRLSIGSAMTARYLRQRQGKGPWTVLRGGIGVNVPAPEPDSGVMFNVNMKSLNVDQWMALGSAVAGPAAADATAAAGPQGLAQYVTADVLSGRADELIIAERKLDNVVVGVSHLKSSWQANIDSRQASGHITWNEPANGQGLGKVTARLATLIIPESAAAEVKDLLESSKSAAATIPGLDIVADRFELFNKPLGKLELVASNERVAAGREWRINRLSMVNPDGELKATGKWLIREGKSTTNLNFNLDIADAGRLLDRLGFPDTLKRGKGKLSGDVSWNGLPYSLDAPSLSGTIALNVAAGQFLKKDPGAAKLLGVLSLQALPRLLKLDFHDVFSEGLAFDGINATAVIAKGVLKTDNLKMYGVAATVLMDGSADIANESTNLRVVVVPEFNLGTGPLVYALAVNPVIGLGSFLAQLFLRAPMMEALTYEMKVEGPWKAPVVTKLAKRTVVAPAGVPPAP